MFDTVTVRLRAAVIAALPADGTASRLARAAQGRIARAAGLHAGPCARRELPRAGRGAAAAAAAREARCDRESRPEQPGQALAPDHALRHRRRRSGVPGSAGSRSGWQRQGGGRVSHRAVQERAALAWPQQVKAIQGPCDERTRRGPGQPANQSAAQPMSCGKGCRALAPSSWELPRPARGTCGNAVHHRQRARRRSVRRSRRALCGSQLEATRPLQHGDHLGQSSAASCQSCRPQFVASRLQFAPPRVDGCAAAVFKSADIAHGTRPRRAPARSLRAASRQGSARTWRGPNAASARHAVGTAQLHGSRARTCSGR
jgi:hypothetical protein